jgi:hypothetical protein
VRSQRTPPPVMQAMVAAILVDTIGSLDLSWPEVS